MVLCLSIKVAALLGPDIFRLTLALSIFGSWHNFKVSRSGGHRHDRLADIGQPCPGADRSGDDRSERLAGRFMRLR
jgi:hypothetical protein